MKDWKLKQQIERSKSSNFRASLTTVVAAVLGFFGGNLFKRARKLTGLMTKSDRMELFEERRRIFNLQRGHAHPAMVSAARRHGMEKN